MVVLRRGKVTPNTLLLTGTPPRCFRHRRRSALSSPRPLSADASKQSIDAAGIFCLEGRQFTMLYKKRGASPPRQPKQLRKRFFQSVPSGDMCVRWDTLRAGLLRQAGTENFAKVTQSLLRHCYAMASAICIMSRKVFCRSSAVHSSPLNGRSEMVHMHSAFLPVRAALQ